MATNKGRLGNTGLDVPHLTFGGNVFGWTVDEKTSFSLLDALLEYNLNFIDTANVYSNWVDGNKGGESETIIGKWLRQSGNRDKVIIATKVGSAMTENEKGLSADYIKQAVDESLKRLHTDYIDVYFAHRDDESTPLEETLTAFDELIKQGKVRAIGASNYTAPRLEEALRISEELGLARYEVLQPEYNLYDRADYEKTLEPVVLRHGLGVVNYYSLASGFLTGKYRSKEDAQKSKRGENVIKTYLNERGLKILDALDKVANAHNVGVTQISLAWLMAQESITAPIVSATSLEQLTDLINATQLELTDEEVKALTDASAY